MNNKSGILINDTPLLQPGRNIGWTNPYREEIFNQQKSFLIICEGKNTEPLYFENFPVGNNAIVTLGGCGSKTALVKYAAKIREQDIYEGREVWCVFDFDREAGQASAQANDFNNAIRLAEANRMQVAWSNDSFELWFVLHYQKLDTALTREELYSILKEKWGLESFTKESKTAAFCAGHYARHREGQGSSQELAIRRARELHLKYKGRHDYSNHCPCTTVYLLVEELNKMLNVND